MDNPTREQLSGEGQEGTAGQRRIFEAGPSMTGQVRFSNKSIEDRDHFVLRTCTRWRVLMLRFSIAASDFWPPLPETSTGFERALFWERVGVRAKEFSAGIAITDGFSIGIGAPSDRG
jgi:hypothetical protein